jgi:hypothetical protein
VCSSPKLIAAYHVLLSLLEPRHPPCALIRFKTIQILSTRCLTTLKVTLGFTTFFQYVKELCLLPDVSLLLRIRRCAGLEPIDPPAYLLRITSSCLKELFVFSGPGSQAIRPANDFERAPPVRAVRAGGGGYRSRTDDPLLAKQVL